MGLEDLQRRLARAEYALKDKDRLERAGYLAGLEIRFIRIRKNYGDCNEQVRALARELDYLVRTYSNWGEVRRIENLIIKDDKKKSRFDYLATHENRLKELGLNTEYQRLSTSCRYTQFKTYGFTWTNCSLVRNRGKKS